MFKLNQFDFDFVTHKHWFQIANMDAYLDLGDSFFGFSMYLF